MCPEREKPEIDETLTAESKELDATITSGDGADGEASDDFDEDFEDMPATIMGDGDVGEIDVGDDFEGDQTLPSGVGEDMGDATLPTADAEGMNEDRTVSHASSGGGRSADDTAGPPTGGVSAKPQSRSAGKVFAGRFEVISVLGEGGMGKVFHVRDRQIEGRELALKILRPRFSRNPRFRQLFFQEIHAAQNFVSENVVQVRDTGQMEDGKLYLTMDLVEGEDLHQLLKREGSLNERHTLEIARQTLMGLQSGQEQGFIHRDIKPSNIMLAARVSKTDENPYGVGVHLLDFGIAGLAAEVGGQIAGTPMYMSPEQAQGQRLDPRSDLFSVGVMMYECLTGSRPFQGTTVKEVVTSLLETKVSPMIAELRHLSKPIQKILQKALQKDREKRFQNAQEFIDAIEKSKAFRMPSELPAGTGFLLAVLGIATLGQGAYIFVSSNNAQETLAEKEKRITDLQDSVTRLNTDIGNERATFANQKSNELNQKDEVIAGLNTQLGTKQDLIDKLNGDIVALQQSLSEQSDVVTLDTAVGEASDMLIQSQIDELKEKLRKLEQRNQDLEDMNAQLLFKDSPQAVAAAGFDKILTWVEKLRGVSARSTLNVTADSGNFSVGSGDGRTMLEHLIAVAENIESFDLAKKSGQMDSGKLIEARARLEEAATGVPDFEVESQEWLTVVGPGKEDPKRLSRLTELIVQLDEEIASRESSLAEANKEGMSLVTQGSAIQDPSNAIELAKLAGPEVLMTLLGRLTSELKTQYESGGVLKVKDLNGVDALASWTAFLEGDGAAIDFSSSEKSSLYDFWNAQRWYTGDDEARMQVDFNMPSVASGDAFDDWRAELSLQVAIHKGSGYPQRSGTVAVYRLLNNRNDNVTWFIETAQPPVESGGAKTWTIKKLPFKQDSSGNILPSTAQETDIRREGWTFTEAGRTVLDLVGYGSDIKVVAWDRLAETDLPAGYKFPNDDRYQAFASEFKQGEHPCLQVDDGKTVRWFSPEFGLVREELDSGIVRDLVYRGSL